MVFGGALCLARLSLGTPAETRAEGEEGLKEGLNPKLW